MTRRILPAFLLVSGISILVFFLTAGLARPSLEEVPDFGALDVSFFISFAMFLPMGRSSHRGDRGVRSVGSL